MKLEGDTHRIRARLRGAGEQGAVMVEFALVLPLLLLLLFGIVEFGRAFNYWIDETHLANVGARWAAVDRNPGPGSSLAESVLLQADTEELRKGAHVCISFPDGSAGRIGEPVEARVTYDFNWIPLIGNVVGSPTTTLTGAATMRLERRPSEYTQEGC